MPEKNDKVRLVRAQVVDGYNQGATLRQLASVYNVSPVTIRNVLKVSGVTLRKRGRLKKLISADQGVRAEGDTV